MNRRQLSKQQGVVLLLSLVLILLLTVLTVSALRSTMFGVKNTALLQAETEAYHMLNSELVAQLDDIKDEKDDNPAQFEVTISNLVDGLVPGGGGTTTLTVINADAFDNSRVVATPSVTMATWKVQDQTLGVNSNEIPRITESLCTKSSAIGQSCYNFAIIVQAQLVATGTQIQQMSGFGMADPSAVKN